MNRCKPIILTGRYKCKIFTHTGLCKEFRVATYDFAIERINHFRNNWEHYYFATLVYFDGVCWIELEHFDKTVKTYNHKT